MSKSIISNERECFVCGTPLNLHKHHIFYGYGNRKTSDREGCWCYLCIEHHEGNTGVHHNMPFNIMLRKFTQERWEAQGGEREYFIRLFGHNYL